MQQEKVIEKKLTPKSVLFSLQKELKTITDNDSDYQNSEPFPVEVSELFLYSPDGSDVLLVFPFLGEDFVLSENEISVESDDKVLVINEPLQYRILQYLVFRAKIIKNLSI